MWPTILLQESGFDWNALLDENIIVFLIPLAGCLIGLAAVIGHAWYLVVKAKAEADLKKSMIEKGMSADDIERIIDVGIESKRKAQGRRTP
ncbi:hypothetical protein ACFL5Z_16020 [Planctomycetota bacterium]